MSRAEALTQLAPSRGPVSARLEAELRSFVQKNGIAVWLDGDGHYVDFVDGLVARWEQGDLPFEVFTFRGSHLALMLALEGRAAGTHRPHLVIHLPHFTEDKVKETPLLELYEAGRRFWKALPTLIEEAAGARVPAPQIEAFLSQAELSLESADVWLSALLASGSSALDSQLRAMAPTAVIDDLVSRGHLAKSAAVEENRQVIWRQLCTWTGLPDAWSEMVLPPTDLGPESLAFAASSWALAVEYVSDLKRAPVNPLLGRAAQLPNPVVDVCRGLARHLREHHAGRYDSIARQTEDLLPDEVNAAEARDLGKIDTFRFEEDTVLRAALDALGTAEWSLAGDWADARLEPKGTQRSFWVEKDLARKNTWQLVQGASRLGLALVHAGPELPKVETVEEAVAAYVAKGAAVDRAHRQLEQLRLSLLYPMLPEYRAAQAQLDAVRARWHAWADRWARGFNALCTKAGFLPSPSLQQRTILEQVVKPLVDEHEQTAYFMVDALRFEMGEELLRQLSGTSGTRAHLEARLAELPSVTEVGMNVLALSPTREGRLRPDLAKMDGGSIAGFSSGEFRVHDPETRRRAIHDRVGGTTCPWLSIDTVVSEDAAALKRRIAQARLVVVHSTQIDKQGEKGSREIFELELQKLRAAWTLLREVGVRRFVITSDHGFLLLDRADRVVKPHGRKIDPQRRHVFSSAGVDLPGEARVALADLRYEGLEGHLMFPDGIAVFDRGHRSDTFVHGGNSFQERVIPVLTVLHKTSAGGNVATYAMSAERIPGMAGMHCLKVTVEAGKGQGVLGFAGAKEIELGLRALESDGVRVELQGARGRAELRGGAIVAPVGESFELFFRLTGPADARVAVELFHPSRAVSIEAFTPAERFEVTAMSGSVAPGDPVKVTLGTPVTPASDWLDRFEDSGVRQVFAHLEAHGTVTEDEVIGMLGGPRPARRFAIKFEEHAVKAPFAARIDAVAGVKRYVREGSRK